MKLNLFLLVITGCLVIACNNKPSEPSKNQPKEVTNNTNTPAAETESVCYRYIGNKDTVYLSVNSSYNMLTGLLMYKYYQKDQNLGTIQGQMMGNILLADYTFKSEGTMSIRQVAFKKIGNDLVEGFGDVLQVNGKTLFKDVNSLKFNDAMVLKNVPCRK